MGLLKRGYKTIVIERWEEHYNKFNSYPCKRKGCVHKKRNGRCNLKMWRKEIDIDGLPTGKCLDYKTGGVK